MILRLTKNDELKIDRRSINQGDPSVVTTGCDMYLTYNKYNNDTLFG